MQKSKVIKLLFAVVILGVFIACGNGSKKETSNQKTTAEQPSSQKQKLPFAKYSESIYVIQTFDGTRELETAQCFVVGENTLLAPFSIFRGATRAVVKQLNGTKTFEIKSFKSYDRILDLIILYSDEAIGEPLKLYTGTQIKSVLTYKIGVKASTTLPVLKGKCLEERVIQGDRFYKITNQIFKKEIGAPIFVSNGKVLGMGILKTIMYEPTYMTIPAIEIQKFIQKTSKETIKDLANIGNPNGARNSKIKRIRLLTDYGEIDIRLYNETPAYRDNFVQLAEEGYYDSLLIHRVIRNFGIQMGAADTRHALADDPVGWKGPGYTIPAHIVPELFHKRGAIGVPRLPDKRNKKLRSDGSQFYMVTGRTYIDSELDDIEKENNIKFTAAQREVYRTQGGAPHLDGSYTVFGEVASGIEIADRITNVAVGHEYRPQIDIRLKKVIIEY